ncbi:hypothetical protein [Novosphingobium colocasiae]|uniref:hypothetical protein n=1 Tax=Novosphingobium colocasiae TaxID=1256513 RepID=UPI0035B0B2B9
MTDPTTEAMEIWNRAFSAWRRVAGSASNTVAASVIATALAERDARIVAWLRMGQHVHSRSGSLAMEEAFNLAAAELQRRLRDVRDEAIGLRIELAERNAEIAGLRVALADPNAVHVNMLAGHIAKPSPAQIWHIYREELLADMPSDIGGQIS